MLTNLNTRVLLSLAAIGVAGALIIGATIAFFSDTETSEGNILKAGALDLKIDSEAHYAGLVCVPSDGQFDYVWALDPNGVEQGDTIRTELVDTSCEGTFDLTDLTEEQLFELTDIKPGDNGENTISLHVFDNDAWGRIRVHDIVDQDETCTEPEIDVEAEDCVELDGDGELVENLDFHLWLDEGTIPGFQCYVANEPRDPSCDPFEGDNVFNREVEEDTNASGVLVPGENDSIVLNLAPALAEAYSDECVEAVDENNDPIETSSDGHDNYGYCHGLAEDGRLVGSATYYIGVAWELDPQTGNEAQTDSVSANISFDITQHRNQPNPWSGI